MRNIKTYKRIMTILILAVTVLVLAISTSAVSGWTDKQNKVHEIADMARSLGLPEDDPIIRRASEIWWQEDAAKKAEAAKPKLTSIGTMYITGYDNCVQCCGKWAGGATASGVMPTVNHTVAMSSDYPFGTVIYIEGLGYYTVEDRGVGRGTVDVYCNNHSECYAVTSYREVFIVEAQRESNCPRCGTGGYVWYMDNSKFIAKCTNCGHYFRKDEFPLCVLDGETKTKQTNADRLYAMTTEEKAEFLATTQINILLLAFKPFGIKPNIDKDMVVAEWLEWLKQEVDDEMC